jgi:two-component system, chemotaxis family, protein-glutamate methylesterase/glutaminase
MTQPGHKTAPATLRGHELEAIVIGGSAGVIDVLRTVLAALPSTLMIPVLIVVHLPTRSHSSVHESLQFASVLPMRQAEDKEPLQGGTIYFASPGYHLLVEVDRSAAQSLDEPVYYSRPSIDVLFDSASDVYKRSLLGILLTGASPDGADGLRAIHDAGGLTIVQDPASSEASAMPRAALELFEPDFVATPAQIAELLRSLDSSRP